MFNNFRIIKCEACFKKLSAIKQGEALANDENCEVIKICNSKEEAYAELKKYSSDVRFEKYNVGSGYRFTEYCVEEYEADEDGEFIEGSDFQPTELEGVEVCGNGHFKYTNGEWVDLDLMED